MYKAILQRGYKWEEKELKREAFAKDISDQITDSFLKYFEKIDTVNGFPVNKSE